MLMCSDLQTHTEQAGVTVTDNTHSNLSRKRRDCFPPRSSHLHLRLLASVLLEEPSFNNLIDVKMGAEDESLKTSEKHKKT